MSEHPDTRPSSETNASTDQADQPGSDRPNRRWPKLLAFILVLGVLGLLIWRIQPAGWRDLLPVPEGTGPKYETAVSKTKTGQEAVPPGMVRISPRKRQLIAVTTDKAEVRSLSRTIRTVGRVEVDERKLEHVHIKLKGWIEKMYIRFTGEEVRKGQKMFEIYSPELVSTQEEYLLALEAMRKLGTSKFPEVAEGARSLLKATRRRFEFWDIRENHIEELERTGTILRTLPLHAPISGFVSKINVREGMYVTPDLDIYTLADLSNVWVLADMYEYEIADVEIGQEAEVTLPYYQGRVFHGKVTYIYPVLDPKTRTVKVRFEFPNPDWKLKPGMFANVSLTIPLGERLVVPTSAVMDSGTEQLVFLYHEDGLFEPRHVSVGKRTREWVEITDGVAAGDQVVTNGNFLIDSESSLRAAIQRMMPDMKQKGTESGATGSMPGMPH